MRIAIACGGTGGHFYPGYALARKLRSRGHEVLFLLRRGDPASARLLARDLPFVELDLRGMPRGLSPRWPAFLWKLASSLRVALHLLRAYRPSALVGMGGYLTFPAAMAARLEGIPFILHESNAVLGLANRACLSSASALALGLPLDRPLRGVSASALTGTPVREELLTPSDPAEARKALGLDPVMPTVLVFGGSQGARSINRTFPKGLCLLAARRPGAFQVLHLSGPAEEASVSAAYATAGSPLKAVTRGYLEGMAQAYAAADLVVCRAGASTLAELFAQTKPALLIPYPGATAAHQEANARVLVRAGAAAVLPDASLTAERAAARVEELLFSGRADALSRMASAYGALRLPEPSRCADMLADIVESAGGRHLEEHR